MPANARDKLGAFVFGVLCGIVGFICGVLYGYSPLITFEWTLSLNQVFSGLVAISLALLATRFLDRQKQDFRTERDLFVKRVETVQAWLTKFEHLLEGETYDYGAASAIVKQVRRAVFDLKTCLKQHGHDRAAECCNEIDAMYGKLRDLFTDSSTSLPKKRKTTKGQVELTDLSKAEIAGQIGQLTAAHFNLILAINRG